MNSNLRSISRSFMSGFKSVESSATTLSTDKNVLYIMLVIAFVNVLGYLMMGNFEAVVFFAVVAYLSTFFTKNMVIVFLVSILATNFLMVSKVSYFRNSSKEGMKNKAENESTDETAADESDNDNTANDKENPKPTPKPTHTSSETTSAKKTREAMNGKLAPAKFNDDADDDDDVGDAAPFASSKSQIEKAHDNLQKIGGMNAETEQVMKQQQILMENMKTMQPFLESAERFLDKFNMKGIDGLLGKVGLGSSNANASS
jgi:hypothetical protein